jgi:hypothetical protein
MGSRKWKQRVRDLRHETYAMYFVFKMRNSPSYDFALCCTRLVLNCN